MCRIEPICNGIFVRNYQGKEGEDRDRKRKDGREEDQHKKMVVHHRFQSGATLWSSGLKIEGRRRGREGVHQQKEKDRIENREKKK